MSTGSRSIAVLASLCAGAALAGEPAPVAARLANGLPRAAAPEGARPVEVRAPGWARVMLDGPAYALGAPGESWAVLDGAGRRVPLAAVHERTGVLPVRLVSAGEGPSGWSLVLDAGAAPVLHDALELEMSGNGIASDVAIDGSDDLRTWTPVAHGALFNVGGTETLRKNGIRHAPDAHRFVRVSWPKGAGQPRFERAAVHAIPYRPLPRGLPLAPPAEPGPGPERSVVVAAAPPAPPVVALDVVSRTASTVAVYVAERARWRRVGTADLQPGCPDPAQPCEVGTPTTVAVGPGRVPAAFRLDGLGAAGLVSAEARVPLTWLMFRAPAAGTYRVVAGGAAPAADKAAPVDPGTIEEPVTAALLGASIPFAPPAAGPDVTKTVRPLEMPRQWWSWVVDAPAAKAGDVVRIDLPDALFARPGVRPEYLRPVVMGDGVVPFALALADVPAPAGPDLAVAPAAAREGARYEIPLPGGTTLVSQMEAVVSGADPALLPPARIGYRAPLRPGGAREIAHETTHEWSCGPGPECRVLFDVAPPDGATDVVVTLPPVTSGNAFAARGAVPAQAPRLTARFWRARPSILFTWPGAGDVRLVSGFDPVPQDDPRVVAVTDALLHRPALAATLDLARTERESAVLVQRSKWALFASIAIASLVLVLILVRALRPRSAS